MKRLLCALLRHDWRPLTGYASCNFRRWMGVLMNLKLIRRSKPLGEQVIDFAETHLPDVELTDWQRNYIHALFDPAPAPRTRYGRFLDRLLGPKCGRCGERVFPKDQALHTKDCI